jgi:hypothetical protein
MAYKLTVLPNEPAVVLALYGPAQGDKIQATRDESIALLDAQDRPVYFIVDFTESQITFDHIMKGAALAGWGETSFLHHPNVREALFVTSSDVLENVAEGMRGEMYGNLSIMTFRTLEDAQAYIRANG